MIPDGKKRFISMSFSFSLGLGRVDGSDGAAEACCYNAIKFRAYEKL